MIDLRKVVGYYSPNYPALDASTPYFEFLSYLECCESLNVPGQPSLGRFMRYRQYLKEIGVI